MNPLLNETKPITEQAKIQLHAPGITIYATLTREQIHQLVALALKLSAEPKPEPTQNTP